MRKSSKGVFLLVSAAAIAAAIAIVATRAAPPDVSRKGGADIGHADARASATAAQTAPATKDSYASCLRVEARATSSMASYNASSRCGDYLPAFAKACLSRYDLSASECGVVARLIATKIWEEEHPPALLPVIYRQDSQSADKAGQLWPFVKAVMISVAAENCKVRPFSFNAILMDAWRRRAQQILPDEDDILETFNRGRDRFNSEYPDYRSPTSAACDRLLRSQELRDADRIAKGKGIAPSR